MKHSHLEYSRDFAILHKYLRFGTDTKKIPNPFELLMEIVYGIILQC